MDNTEFGISGLCGITVLLSLGDNFCTSYLVKLSFIFARAFFFFLKHRGGVLPVQILRILSFAPAQFKSDLLAQIHVRDPLSLLTPKNWFR